MALAQTWNNVKPSTLANVYHWLFSNCVDDGENTALEQVNEAVTLIANNSSIESDNIEHLHDCINEETTEEVRELVMTKESSASPILAGLPEAVQIVMTAMLQKHPSATKVEKLMALVLKYLEKTSGFSK